MAIMMVQKALIDDEISEKKAGLLLYSIQIAASNVKQTTFIHEEDKEVVTEMPEEPPLVVSQSQDNIHHGDAEARRNTGSGDLVIGGSGDLESGGSGDRENRGSLATKDIEEHGRKFGSLGVNRLSPLDIGMNGGG